MIRVGIADDHLLVINGLETVLKPIKHIRILFQVADGEQLLTALKTNIPDVLLLDIQMPGASGLELCDIIKKIYPSVQILALTNHNELYYIKQMLRSGATGYLLKNTDQQTLVKAIETVNSGEKYIDEQLKELLFEEMIGARRNKGAGTSLTRRETEILELIAKEFSSQEIADKLFISLRTVETHRFNLTQKLQVKNSAGLIKEAYKRGLV